jgi:hypothetical protein
MCPACVATTLALIAASAGSAGGLTALIVRKVRTRSRVKDVDRKVRVGTAEKGDSMLSGVGSLGLHRAEVSRRGGCAPDPKVA